MQRQQELQRQEEQRQQQILAQQAAAQAAQRQREQEQSSVKDTVRDIIANTDFGSILMDRPKSSGALYPPNSRIIQVLLE